MAQFLYNKYKGQTVLEVVVALGAGIVVLSALTMAVVTSLNNAAQSNSETQAGQFAEQGIEIMRGMRDNNYVSFSSLSGTYCLAASCSAATTALGTCGPRTTSCGTNVSNKFVREVQVEQNTSACLVSNVTPAPGSKQTRVIVNVAWTDNKCKDANDPYCHVTSLDTCLSNFSGRVAP